MLDVLAHQSFRKLFAAQAIALVGTGLMTVALGLLAYDLAGASAGAVLGTALAIKMVAYVGLAPLANALAARLPRKPVLIAADLVRASVAVFLPFIDAVWQIYVLIFVLQAASATFTPAFQATIPDILEDEERYTKALSLSRMAYDIETLASPALAGLLLTFMSFHWLFAGTVAGFLLSAALVQRASLPPPNREAAARPFMERLTLGVRLYLATPRLRGLLGLTLAAAAGSAMALVNTVVIVRADFGGGETDLAIAIAAYGAGSMLAALASPWSLRRIGDKAQMTAGGVLLAALMTGLGMFGLMGGELSWEGFLLAWALAGLFYSAVLTPSGRLLRRTAEADERAALFAAQFALSHACWLITYPLAGWVGESYGMAAAMLVLGGVAVVGAIAAFAVWPRNDA